MAISALEVGTPGLDGRRNIPAAAPFVGDERELVYRRNARDEFGVMEDGAQAVARRESGSA